MDRKTLLGVVGLSLSVFASQAVWVSFAPITTDLATALGVSSDLVGILALTYPGFFLLLTVPSGIYLDRDVEKFILFGVAATTLGAVLRLFSISYWWLFFSQVLAAIGQPFLLNSFVPFASKFSRTSSAVIPILSFSMYSGTIYALATGKKLYSAGGIYAVIIPIAAVALLGAALTIWFFAIRNDEGALEEYERRAEAGGKEPDQPKGEGGVLEAFKGLLPVLKKRDILLVSGILGFGVATFDNIVTWLQPVLKEKGLHGIAGISVAISLFFGLIGVLVLTPLIAKKNKRTLYIRGTIFLILAFFLFLSVKIEAGILVAVLSVSGFFMLPVYPLFMDWIERFCEPEFHGRATGVVGLISRLIAITLGFAAIKFTDSSTRYFLFLSAALFISLFLSFWLPRDDKMAGESSGELEPRGQLSAAE